MGVRLVVAVTDRDWFEHLRQLPGLAEVNFWSPSPRSKRIRQEFENGRDYYALHGRPVTLPVRKNLSPDAAALQWHNEERFLG